MFTCVFVCVCVTIVMTVDIGDVSSFVLEGEGVLMVPLVKSEGAVGQVAVRLTTQNITATGNTPSLTHTCVL